MSDTEPTLLRDPPGSGEPRAVTDPVIDNDVTDKTEPSFADKPRSSPRIPVEPPKAAVRGAPVVHVVGFWKRALAAAIDLTIVIPTALLLTLIVSRLSGVRLPSSNMHLLDIDLWIDLVLATDPALVMAMVLVFAVGLTYLLVFHIVVGRTLGMRVLKLRVIDVYGDRPSPARCAARCAGYLASVATLFLGFLWMGFDSEKRGLQDWIAGTYVIRA
ncbi:MAG TPA: RDD family protein [Kofleriaceae bacterium]|nr:RDD family protein [Kofleriaceae bacterium]